MISRHWRAVARIEEADNYIAHLEHETFPQLKKIDGFIRASILKRSVDEGIEFIIITIWSSIESIHKFAGDKAETAVVPQVVQDMMIEYDKQARHYEIAVDYQ